MFYYDTIKVKPNFVICLSQYLSLVSLLQKQSDFHSEMWLNSHSCADWGVESFIRKKKYRLQNWQWSATVLYSVRPLNLILPSDSLQGWFQLNLFKIYQFPACMHKWFKGTYTITEQNVLKDTYYSYNFSLFFFHKIYLKELLLHKTLVLCTKCSYCSFGNQIYFSMQIWSTPYNKTALFFGMMV